MKNSMFRSPFVRIVTAIAVVFASASLSADEPAAKDAKPHQAEQAPPESEQQSLTVSTADRLLQLLTNADSLIGVEVISVDDVLRSHLGLAEGKGLTVTNVSEGSAAAQAGLQANDVLVAVGEQEIAGAEGLHKSLEGSLDKAVSLTYIRGGQHRKVEVTPRAGVALALRAGEVVKLEEPKFWLGVSLANADDTLRSQLGVPAGEGLVVTSVEGESPASKAGVMANDLLLKLDGKPLKTTEELTVQLQEIADRSATMELLRRGKPATLTVTPEKPSRQAEVLQFNTSVSAFPVYWTATQQVTGLNYSGLTLDPAGSQWFVNSQPYTLSLLAANQPQPQPDLAAQVKTLLEQAKQLQASLESLQTALEAQAPPPATPEAQKPQEKSP